MSDISRRHLLAGSGALAAAAAVPAAARPAPATASLAGKSFLVTGASSGFGRLGALHYARLGARVFATMRNLPRPEGEELARIAQDEKLDLHVLPLDVLSEEQAEAAVAEAEKRNGGPLDVLVNNAGIAQGGRIEMLTEDDWRQIVDINLLGVARGCRTFVPVLKNQGSGRIVNTASLAGLVHPPTMSSYTAVKAAVVAISESLRWELEPSGVAVSVVCPSFFRTNLSSSLNSSDPAAAGFASKLIDRSERGADEIAAEVMTALDAGEFLILPDPDARKSYRAKRLLPAVYARTMTEMGRKFAAGVSRS